MLWKGGVVVDVVDHRGSIGLGVYRRGEGGETVNIEQTNADAPMIDYVDEDTSSFSAELLGKPTPHVHSDIAHFFPSHACIRTATALCMILL